MGWKWRTTPVYPGVDLDLGDRYYTPGTRESGIVYSQNLIPDEDINRIKEQTQGNQNYILRPSSQSGWRPKAEPNYLNNVYSKRGGNQFNQSTPTPAVNTMTLQTLNNIVPKSPVKEFTPTAELPTAPTPTYNRSQTRDYMRSIGMNPYDYSGGERKALRTYLNNPSSMDSKYQPFINQVQNQRTQKMVNSIGTNQLLKPETDTNKLNNQLVNLKFKQGGQMYKYQAGAQMVQPQQANSQDPIDQIAQIAVGSLQGDKASKQKLIEVLSNEQIAPKLLQMVDKGVKNQDKRAMIIAQAIKALQGGSRKARLGAKLDYIKQSIGECPEGQEVVYFKKGGEICKMCAGKKMQDGGKSDPIKNFKKKKKMK